MYGCFAVGQVLLFIYTIMNPLFSVIGKEMKTQIMQVDLLGPLICAL